jgi:hypothetical protein
MKMNYTVTVDTNRILRNINGLSVGDRAHCGHYGIVECYAPAVPGRVRKFKVSKSTVLSNRGNWDMTALRKAITAVR